MKQLLWAHPFKRKWKQHVGNIDNKVKPHKKKQIIVTVTFASTPGYHGLEESKNHTVFWNSCKFMGVNYTLWPIFDVQQQAGI